MNKKIIFGILILAILSMLVLSGCTTPKQKIEKTKDLCEKTNGNWMGCPIEVPLDVCLNTRCLCSENQNWDKIKGCI